MLCYKSTRATGTDFYSGRIDYAGALDAGTPVEIADAEPPTGSVCGHGLHVFLTARKMLRAGGSQWWPRRWFEVEVADDDVIEGDDEKLRVRCLHVLRELTIDEIFGTEAAARMERVGREMLTWNEIPWLRRPRPVSDEEIEAIFARWHAAIQPWVCDELAPELLHIVHDQEEAPQLVNFTVGAHSGAADVAAHIALATAADDTVVPKDSFPYWRPSFLQPHVVLWRHASWIMVPMTEPSPWAFLIQLYRLGCLPAGYLPSGKFTIYAPKTALP